MRINPDREDAFARIRQITGGIGIDYTLETTASMRVLRQAIDVLARRGTCGFVGGAPVGAEVTIDAKHVMTGGRTIRGIIEGDANPDVFLPKLIGLYLAGRFPFDRMATFYAFDDINIAVDDTLHGKVVKPILRMPNGAGWRGAEGLIFAPDADMRRHFAGSNGRSQTISEGLC